MIDVTIQQVTEYGLLDVVPLKNEHDNEVVRQQRVTMDTLDLILKLDESGYHFWVAYKEKEPVGYAVGHHIDDERYVSDGVFVLRDQRKKGIGKLLKTTQIAFARSLGCQLLTTSVAQNNEASIALQNSVGAVLKPSDSGYVSTVHLQ